jgi:hypothetical protein
MLLGLMGAEDAFANTPILPINVTSNSIANLNGDGVFGLTDCVLTQSSSITTVTCPAPAMYAMPTGTVSPGVTFSPMIVIDDAGMGSDGKRVPFVGAVGTVTGGGSVALSIKINSLTPFKSANATPNHVARVDIASGENGSGYSFGSTQTLICNNPSYCSMTDGRREAVGTPGVMSAIASTVAVANPGTMGQMSGSCTLTTTSQIGVAGLVTTFLANMSGGTIASATLIQPGSITSDVGTFSSSSLAYTDPVIGCGFTTGTPLISFQYGVAAEEIEPGTGVYASKAPCNIGTATTMTTGMGYGSGLEVTCSTSAETFPGTVSIGTDNTAALQALIGNRGSPALGTINKLSSIGQPQCLYFPPGTYFSEPTNQWSPSPAPAAGAMQGFGCVFGDQHYISNIYVIPNFQGDMFALDDSNANNSIPDLANTMTFSDFGPSSNGNANQGGSSFRNLMIVGDRLSAQPQNGIVFYGGTNFVHIDNVVIDFMIGRALYAGAADGGTVPSGNLSESVIQNLRLEEDGNGSTVPAMEITSYGTSQGSNTDSFSNIRVYQPFGPGFQIHSNGTGQAANGFRLINIFLEGSKLSATTSGGDLLLLGDATPSTGNSVGTVLGRNVQLVNPVIGHAALRITADAGTHATNIDIQGSITSTPNDLGRGVQVEACQECFVKMAGNGAVDYGLVVGANGTISAGVASACTGSKLVSPGIIYDGEGGEQALNACLDTAAGALVQTPVRQLLGSGTTINQPSSPLPDLIASVVITSGTTLTTGASGRVPINQVQPTWTVIRSGPTEAFTDYWDTGSNIISNLGGPSATALMGQLYRMRVCNTTGYTEIIQPQTIASPGATGTVTLSSGVCLPITMTILNTGTVAFVAN